MQKQKGLVVVMVLSELDRFSDHLETEKKKKKKKSSMMLALRSVRLLG